MQFPAYVKLVEVGPRDGLQNEKVNLPTADKVKFIEMLAATGLTEIEATSFVSPKWIPQLADHAEVWTAIKKKPTVNYPVLIPNLQGLDEALALGVKSIAVFTTPSEAFCQKNTNCSVQESLDRIQAIMDKAKAHDVQVRAYLSCVLGCPYEGKMPPEKVTKLATLLYKMGAYEISLGDTIGVGTPLQTATLLEDVLTTIPKEALAVHFHDTYGQALANIYVALTYGIATIDASVGGLGGCPYAKGASGNVATEDVLYMLTGMGIETGIDLTQLVSVANWIVNCLGRAPTSKVAQALNAKCESKS